MSCILQARQYGRERHWPGGTCSRRLFLSSVMSLPRPSSVYDLDRRIFQLETELAYLRQRRNAYAPVFALPDEILVKIFKHMQFGAGSSTLDLATHDWTWYKVTAVCAHFRSLATRTPMLWAVLDCRRITPAWASLCVERSRDTPLRIKDSRTNGLDLLPRACVAEVGRGPGIQRALDRPASDLQVLQLEDAWATVLIMPSFLGGQGLVLVHLRLCGEAVTLIRAPPMSLLRHLELTRIYTDPSLRALRQLFEGTPSLEVLSLNTTHLSYSRDPADPAEVIAVSSRVTLPRLQTLLIHHTVAEASALLRLLPPPAMHLHIRIVDETKSVLLNRNHLLVHEAYLEFVRRLPNPSRAGLAAGHIRLGGKNNPIQFGQLHNLAQLFAGEYPGTVAFLAVEYIRGSPSTHPILAAVETLTCTRAGSLLSTAHSLPNVCTVMLKGWCSADELNPGPLEWFRKQAVRHVSFQHCDEELQSLYATLRDEGLVLEAEWVD
jgi:hypothetical protein